MGNPVVIGAKLNLKRSSLSTVEGKIAELIATRSELEASIEGVETEEDLTAIEATVKENADAIEEAEGEKTSLEEEIEGLESELAASNRKKPKAGGKRNMSTELEKREAINAFVRSKGPAQERAEYTTVEGGALIPEDLMPPRKELVDTLNLEQYIRKINVNRGSGKYPIIKKSDGKFTSVQELAKNPELAIPTFEEVTYDIETYRGFIPVSQEAIDDSDYNILGLISEDIKGQELNTKNAQIAAVLKTAPAKAVTGLDGIITMFNKDFKKVYNTKAFVSSSLYNVLDLLKDKNGRYLLEDDITVTSGKRIKGKEIVVLDDDVIGSADGDLVGFFGDAYEFATLFDRKQATVKWVDNDIYGQLLAAFVRFDIKGVDDAAGYYVTFTPDADTP